MKFKLLYFARLQDAFGTAAEELESDAATVEELLIELRLRGTVWAQELAPKQIFRVAVNQEMADLTTLLANNDEVAIFPPVTGG
ncbi:MoaD/ThiS family protein [Neisseriaceae bacterium TC5R-5]|nr:MoaD/ThiS family protein [Neisseriaceae bacterium TC5R-5]